ncbi:MAG: S8 family peptidase [Elusimicrobia bacterium]|nr:S8 family peptidase [Elusimicrobiota bacterium]
MVKMWRMWSLLAAMLLGGWSAGAFAQAFGERVSILPNERIITFQANLTTQQRADVVREHGGTVTHDLRLINAVAARFPSDKSKNLDSILKARPEVTRVELDYRQKWIESSPQALSAVDLPSAGSVVRSMGLRDLLPGFGRRRPKVEPQTPWGVARVNAPKAWKTTKGGGVKVAVIDTGIDYTHPQLAPNVKGGWNFTTADTKAYKDDHGHGTHVSGTIAATVTRNVRNKEQAVWGIAPKANLYGVKVLDAGGSGTFADVIAGILWAAENKMDIANMSLGASRGTPALAEAVTAAVKSGLVIVAAAGNSGGAVGYPAAYPEMIAVSAIDSSDALARFSSRGPEVDFTAPGVSVPSTWLDGGYNTISGTSMACPHVVGLATLAISARRIHGEATVRDALKGAATPLPGLTPDEQGAGLVDAEKLVAKRRRGR